MWCIKLHGQYISAITAIIVYCQVSKLSALLWREQDVFNEMAMTSALNWIKTLYWIFKMLAHWNKNLRVHMFVYSGTLSRFRAIFHMVPLQLNTDIHTANVNQAVSYLSWYFFSVEWVPTALVHCRNNLLLVMTNDLSPSVTSTSAG